MLAAVRALLPSVTVDRTAGADRYATAVAVAQKFFPAQQASFVLARGDASPTRSPERPWPGGAVNRCC